MTMDVVAELKALKCDPGPVHSPNECDNPQPCPCVVQAAAVAEIERLRSELLKVSERERNYDSAPTDPHHGGKIWKAEPPEQLSLMEAAEQP
jgi:hypothetical protein